MIKQIAQWFKNEVTEEGKKRIVKNIENNNSKEYQYQVAEHAFVGSVIDDILADPIWREIAEQAIQNKGL